MKHDKSTQNQIPVYPENDIRSLFSRISLKQSAECYQEFRQQDALAMAEQRWPLLREINQTFWSNEG